MAVPKILSLATAVPAQRYPQAEIFEYLAPLFERTRHARAVFGRAGVAYRHLVVDREFYRREQRTQARNEYYLAHALPLGEEAIRRCEEVARVGNRLHHAGLRDQDRDRFHSRKCSAEACHDQPPKLSFSPLIGFP